METSKGMTRRGLLMASAVAGISAFLAGCSPEVREAYFRKRFRELSPEEVQDVMDREEKSYAARFGKPVSVLATPALDGVVYGYGLDLSRCIGCRRCVYACVEENNQSRDPQVQWIKVLRMKKEDGVDIMKSDAYYNPALVPESEYFYMPVACQQCRKPPCVSACPVKATWQEPDGIVVIDYNWCIGCRCCMAACPYSTRFFNWSHPDPRQVNAVGNLPYSPEQSIPRRMGTVEKCDFCPDMLREGKMPACASTCPMNAIYFGDQNEDAVTNASGVTVRFSQLISDNAGYRELEELGTQPRVYYLPPKNRKYPVPDLKHNGPEKAKPKP
ncbi:MAG: 4Fe-4S dicluster domain-containing protein, partial [Planctomycetota bacterium]|nr:4Fe-4S dicluster domain-containing protein [Planctomycetota bacterium]